MDQIKTGHFIAEMRKEKGMTQKQLAEKLNISDKTVSKWETGNGLPDVALMVPLCEELNINVNELFSGERISEDNYQQKAEENMMDLLKEKQESKRNITLSVVSCIVAVLAPCTIIVLASYADIPTVWRVISIVVAVAAMAGGIFVGASLEMNSGTYECCKCGHRFVPTTGAYLAGVHTPTKRYLKCPKCGEKSFCRKRLTH